jgi:hypothetical protein
MIVLMVNTEIPDPEAFNDSQRNNQRKHGAQHNKDGHAPDHRRAG